MSAAAPMLDVRDLHLSYGHIRALQGVSLVVRAGEIVTLVTDRPIGSSSFRPWVADAPADASLEYSVVELTVPIAGDGEGTMSIAADVLVDSVAGTVSLERSQRAPVLGEVVKQPKPYWATDD